MDRNRIPAIIHDNTKRKTIAFAEGIFQRQTFRTQKPVCNLAQAPLLGQRRINLTRDQDLIADAMF